MHRGWRGGLALLMLLGPGIVVAGEPVRLDDFTLDEVTAARRGFAFFLGAGTAAFNGAGGSAIEGQGSASWEQEVTSTPSGGVRERFSARSSYSGSAKAEAFGGTATATLTAGSGVVFQ
ncbi:MAG: hypothetical protein RMK73_14700 [Geminicoccaceae bacterium]|nr:hypothetical protein [Geminicoccaceae bacterium]MDW8342730.1 hypothetical protein [Geminicoccaceae bacterium]